MPEYLNGKIYTIRSYKSDLIFYGAPTTALARCLASYKDKYRKHTVEPPLQKPQAVFELIQFDDVYIELVEAFPCTCSDALKKRVLELVREHPDSLNTKQIKKNVKVEIKEVRVQINHGEQRDVHHKCLCGGQYRIHQRARHYKTKIHTDYVANTN